MLLAISLANVVLWILYVLFWGGCTFAILLILSLCKIKLPWPKLSVGVWAILSAISLLVSMTGIGLFEDKLLMQSASGQWTFGPNHQNEIRIDLNTKTYTIKSQKGEIFSGKTTILYKSEPEDDNYFYLYILGYPNEMSSMMMKFQALHSPQITYKDERFTCR